MTKQTRALRTSRRRRSLAHIARAAALAMTAGALLAGPAGAEPRVEEGGTLKFDVSLPKVLPAYCRMDYNYSTTRDGTAGQGTDFEKVEGTLVFWPGVLTHTIEVKTLTDHCREDDETVELSVTDGKLTSFVDWGNWAEDCERWVRPWKEKTFVGTIVDDGRATRSGYEVEKYGCHHTGGTFGE